MPLHDHTVWDRNQAMRTMRRFVAEHLAGQPLVVAALDESGREKTGEDTVGVQRPHQTPAGDRHLPGDGHRPHDAAQGRTGDEVYDRSGQLRLSLHDHGVGCVMRVGCAFHVDVSPAARLRADHAVARFVTEDAWQIRSVTRVQGRTPLRLVPDRATSPPHCLLLRKHLVIGELAFHYF
ncbi:MAG TPA: hypothetical protein VG674_15870 [Amycolatopsis sp.]|jgi:hypothetical protein|nr:hypothetical protein [Amycolatopsis sp.]